MGTKSMVMLKTHVDSINISFVNEFVHKNMRSLRVFVCNYVVYLFGLIIRYIVRFQVRDVKNDLHVPPPEADSEIDGFREELANFLFCSNEDAHEASEERGAETESSAFMGAVLDVPEHGESRDGESESFVLMEAESEIHEDTKQGEEQTESSADSDIQEDVKGRGSEAEGSDFDVQEMECSVSKETNSFFYEDGGKKGAETEGSVFIETESDVLEDGKKIDGNEKESSIFTEGNSNVHQDSKKKEEEDETEEGPLFTETDTATTTSKCQYVSGKDISGFIEEPTTLSFTFREFYMGPDVSAVSDNAFSKTEIIADKEFSEFNTEKGPVAQEEVDSVQEQRTLSVPFAGTQFLFETEVFCGSDSSDEDYFHFKNNSLESDTESESSSSSGLIWGTSNNIDDSITYQFLASNNSCEGFESEILKLMKEESAEDVEEKQFSCDREGGNSMEKTEESRWEEELAESESESESESDEQYEDDFEWEHDDLVEQLKLELKNARQGGLATILEEEEEGEETESPFESPKMVEDLKPLKIEQKLEFKDQIDEIEKVYKGYAEKMRKLDILNYQTMHAIGLLQLKDPLKLLSAPKSTTVPGGKPIISQNLWPRKATKNKSDPLKKFLHELHRDLELVYVGQVCLSWEILCWQHKKAQGLKEYDSDGSHRYNLVAGEFQLFQVLMQRFIENEPFQGTPRIQNYVKNRCVIRNLLQVPAIKDDSMKDKNVNKGDEENAIESGKLAEIIKESMRVFWEFVRADKDYGNVIFKVSQQIGNDLKDPAISDLLMSIRTQQQKKERKLKDIVRSGNCIVKKFQKHHEDQLDHEQLLAQVGLRLISRVLNMSKLRKEQLIWCNEKLHRIKFLSRKIVQVEPSFLLFPC